MLWSVALAVSSTSTVAVSVVSLADTGYMHGKAALVACLFSILTLVLSLIVSLFNYGGRARDMFHSYRTIQRASVKAEVLALCCLGDEEKQRLIAELDADYQLGLDQSENHTTNDFARSQKIDAQSEDARQKQLKSARRWAIAKQGAVDAIPVAVTLASAFFLGWMFLSL